MFVRPLLFAVALLSITACGDDGGGGPDAGVAPDLSVESAGMYVVGTTTVTIPDPVRNRDLPTQLWYPADPSAAAAAATGFGFAEFEIEPNRTTYAGLLASADPTCATRTAHAARDATPMNGRFPLIAISHCHNCTRFSTATVAERLASHGYLVIAVDHVGNTLWDQLAGDALPLDTTTLELRVGDIERAIDAVMSLDPAIPRPIAQLFDGSTFGVMGHSFGAVTAGKVAQTDARIDAALALAAPMENPLLPGVTVASIARPLGFLLAVEDNSITELGNNLIRDNYTKATAGAWKAEVADAGHWSVSDLVGAHSAFAPGCGAGTRQTDGQPFTYLDAATGRGITAAYATAFFNGYLRADAGALAYLDAARPSPTVTVVRK